MLRQSFLVLILLSGKAIAVQSTRVNPCFEGVRKNVEKLNFDQSNPIVENGSPVAVREIVQKGPSLYRVQAIQRDGKSGLVVANFFATVAAKQSGRTCDVGPAVLSKIVE